jgi:hypothetical protein
MARQKRQLRNTAEVTINPATEDTLSSLSSINTCLIPVTIAPIPASNARTSRTVAPGYTHLVIQNVGNSVVYWGESAVTAANGIKLFPNQGWEFKGCEDGFKVYFICFGAETTTVNVCEM